MVEVQGLRTEPEALHRQGHYLKINHEVAVNQVLGDNLFFIINFFKDIFIIWGGIS
jgi:hypothetical protein